MPQRREVVKISKRTGEVCKSFPTTIDAYRDAQKEGWHLEYRGFLSSIKRKTLGDRRSPYFYRFYENYESNESYKGKRSRPVIILDKEDQHRKYWFATLKVAAEALCVTEGTVRSAVTKHTKILGRYEAYYQPAAGCEGRS